MRTRATSVALFALAVILAAPIVADSASTPATDEQAIRQFKLVDWPRAYREQNVQLLDRLLADEFERIGFGGERSSKQDELARVKATAPNYDTFSFEITRLSIFDNGTAIVSGTGTITGKDADGPYTTTYSSSNVLLKRGGVWRAVASHVSGLKTERTPRQQ
jgi:hypothetical protein